MKAKIAVAHLADSRTDFYEKRQILVQEELEALGWLRAEAEVMESGILVSSRDVEGFANKVRLDGVSALIIHLPIWADPIFSVKLHSLLPLPILLLGNDRPETSSLVGMLGAGGALDQVGCAHLRVFEHTSTGGRRRILAFIRAADARSRLRGQTLGLFGGRSLGIFTASADPAQWQRIFGVDIEMIDQLEIVREAEALHAELVERHVQWLRSRLGALTFNEVFTALGFERQVRSYLATRRLVSQYGLDFIGVKCQPELSDGYVSQCVAHMLMNGIEDADGMQLPVVHACESDADGALTMQVLNLVSGGSPTALLDLRWFDPDRKTWTLANCGAMAAAFYATPEDPSGLSQVQAKPHAFGRGGGAYPAVVEAKTVTLARLCRKAGEYWMAVLPGEVQARRREELNRTTGAFPQAFIQTAAGIEFAEEFGSNHIHMVAGEWTAELMEFCRQAGIPCRLWHE